MKKTELCDRLEKDFVKPGITDGWYEYMPELAAYICPDFKERSIGLMCDFADEITKVYTAVFPSEKVMARILAEGAARAMLFVHHAAVWDINIPGGFYNMNPELLDKFRERQISVFCHHHPLDNYGEFSTGKTLADALGITVEKPFAEYCGAVCGIIGTTDCKSVEELRERYALAAGHETRLYRYGESEIKNGSIIPKTASRGTPI